MHGNRDFLLGPRFCALTGCALLGDYERVTLFGQPVLLTHGDLLCTDDTRYMTLRAELRSAAWQREFLGKPLDERRQVASDLRQLSATEIAQKSDYIMDVNQAAVERTMREHDVTLLLHGHTHRPAVHRFDLGRPPGGADRARRLVSTKPASCVGRPQGFAARIDSLRAPKRGRIYFRLSENRSVAVERREQLVGRLITLETIHREQPVEERLELRERAAAGAAAARARAGRSPPSASSP